MRHNYVTRRNAESHGSWSVNRSGMLPEVLVQLTSGESQTRISIVPHDAMRLASAMMEAATVAMQGGAFEGGDRDGPWTVETGIATAPGITDEVLVGLCDEIVLDGVLREGANGDHRTGLALPIADALEMVEEICRHALRVARDLRADAMSRVGRSPA